jgi:hypothetical protein
VHVDQGFETAGLLVFDIQLPNGWYQTPGSSLQLFDQLDRLIEGYPGVVHSTFSEGGTSIGRQFLS